MALTVVPSRSFFIASAKRTLCLLTLQQLAFQSRTGALSFFSSSKNNDNNNMPPIQRIQPVGDQESVWDYPRPPLVEPVPENLRVIFNGQEIVNTNRSFRVLETSHPPTYYIPKQDIQMQYLEQAPARSTYCEFKGQASYYSVRVQDKVASNCAWSYPSPSSSRFEPIADYVSFYASNMDACYVGDEKVQAQEGDFYGGWITSKIVGPFKGGAGTWGW